MGLTTNWGGQGRPCRGGTFRRRHEEVEGASGLLVGRPGQAEGQKTKALPVVRAGLMSRRHSKGTRADDYRKKGSERSLRRRGRGAEQTGHSFPVPTVHTPSTYPRPSTYQAPLPLLESPSKSTAHSSHLPFYPCPCLDTPSQPPPLSWAHCRKLRQSSFHLHGPQA